MGWIGRFGDTVLVRPRRVAAADPISGRLLEPPAVKAAAGVQRLAELGPRNTRLLNAGDLLNRPALTSLLRLSAEENCAFWIISTATAAEASQLEEQFPGQLTSLGPAAADGTKVFGVRPAALLFWLLTASPECAEHFLGINAVHLPARTREVLRRAGVETELPSRLSRLLRHPQLPIYVVVFIYSVLRALPVSFVKEFHGSIFIFWTLDVVTSIPYTWGVLALVFGAKWQLRLLGGVTTIITFVAPYVYFWLNGSDYPLYVPLVIAGLTLLTVALEAVKYAQERSLEKLYRSQIPKPSEAA